GPYCCDAPDLSHRCAAGHRAAAPRLSAYPGIIWGPALGCPTKATDYTHSDTKVPRLGCSNDPCHGTPCACADGGRGVDTGHVPWRKQQSVADQGNKGAAARVALSAPTKE